MTFLSQIFALFPVLHLFLVLSHFVLFVMTSRLEFLGGLFFFLFIFPVLCFRLLHAVTPIKEGVSDILAKEFSPWWAGHQIQALFNAIPQIESLLKLIPGVYSFWLRLWGAKIGKNVYWTAGCRHYDRNLLEAGDGALFGELCILVSHVITPKERKGLLLVKKIKIGKKGFVGAASVLGPGVIVDDYVMVPADSRIYVDWHVTKDGIIKPPK